MKIIIAALVMFLIAGCASTPRIYDANQAQLNLPYIAKAGQWVEIYTHGNSPDDGPTIMRVTNVDTDYITGDKVSVAGNYNAAPPKQTFTYDEIELIQVTGCDPRLNGSCKGKKFTNKDAAETALVVGVVILKVAWCLAQFSAALNSGRGKIDCD